MQQCNEDFRLALTELETVRKQLRTEKSWLKRLQRRVEVADDPPPIVGKSLKTTPSQQLTLV